MPFYTIFGDITEMETDAIVNAANSGLRPGGGVCGAIFSASGYDKLKSACEKIGHCNPGSAVITKGYDLPARYIIHTVGPIYSGFKEDAEMLESCYRASLELAVENGIKSISFPLVSAGIFGYPPEEAYSVAKETIYEFLKEYELNVYMVLFNKNFNLFTDSELTSELDRLLDSIEDKKAEVLSKRVVLEESSIEKKPVDVKALLNGRSTEEVLEMYRGNTSLRYDSNLTSEKIEKLFVNYDLTKDEIFSIAYGGNMSLMEVEELLDNSGEFISPYDKRDVLLKFALERGLRTIDVNDLLLQYDLKPIE